jgi:hypothetical protein
LAGDIGNGRLGSISEKLPMPAYLVRLIKDRDVVGFFAADDFDDLVVAVDECTDVPACEYVELPPGGIMWTSPAVAVPFDLRDHVEGSEIEELPWEKVELCGAWWSVVYGYTDDEWTRFDPDAPQDPAPESSKRPLGPAKVIPIRKRPL